jgi:hypothetical protein
LRRIHERSPDTGGHKHTEGGHFLEIPSPEALLGCFGLCNQSGNSARYPWVPPSIHAREIFQSL